MSLIRTLLSPQLRATVRPQHFRIAYPSLRTYATSMPSVSNAITQDHRELKRYYDEVINSTDHDHQQRFGNQFVWELARHSIGEELVVYPAMEKYMGDKGKEMADHDRQEHHKVKELLKAFQGMSAQDADFVPKLKEIWVPLSKHIEEEEKEDLPALEQALRAQGGESESMANSFARTKMFVPTRSHPSAGENPPFETVMGLMAAPMDKLADMFRKFPDRSKV